MDRTSLWPPSLAGWTNPSCARCASRRAIAEAVVNRGVSKQEVREIVEKTPREDRKTREKDRPPQLLGEASPPLGIPAASAE